MKKLIPLLALSALACDLGDQIPVKIGTNIVNIDRCLAPIVGILNSNNIPTITSCCGHYRTDGYILLSDRLITITAQTNLQSAYSKYMQDWEHIGRVNEMERNEIKTKTNK